MKYEYFIADLFDPANRLAGGVEWSKKPRLSQRSIPHIRSVLFCGNPWGGGGR